MAETRGFCITPTPTGWALGGDFDASATNRIRDAVWGSVDKVGGVVELDLSQLTFIDSGGLRELITLDQRVAEAGGTLSLQNVPPAFARLVRITGLDDKFDSAPTT